METREEFIEEVDKLLKEYHQSQSEANYALLNNALIRGQKYIYADFPINVDWSTFYVIKCGMRSILCADKYFFYIIIRISGKILRYATKEAAEDAFEEIENNE